MREQSPPGPCLARKVWQRFCGPFGKAHGSDDCHGKDQEERYELQLGPSYLWAPPPDPGILGSCRRRCHCGSKCWRQWLKAGDVEGLPGVAMSHYQNPEVLPMPCEGKIIVRDHSQSEIMPGKASRRLGLWQADLKDSSETCPQPWPWPGRMKSSPGSLTMRSSHIAQELKPRSLRPGNQ